MCLSETSLVSGGIAPNGGNHNEGIPKIGEMFFGFTDANNEYLKTDDEQFLKLFCENPRFDVDKVLDGSVSFVCGNKGAGKTMFLRYAELMAKRAACPTAFVRYKRQVTGGDKKLLRQAARSFDEEVVDDSPNSAAASMDYVLGWQLYLIKVIISLVRSTESGAFLRDSEEWGEMVGLLDDVYSEDESRHAKRLLPKLSKGQVRVKTKHVKMALGFEPKGEAPNCSIPFGELAEGVVGLYASLPCDCDALPAYVFIDEIELAYGKKREYERNVALVRDLVLAVDYLNDIARENGFPVRIVVALRNEVFRSVKSAGYELNKPIEDYGVQIDWRPTADDAENPLIRIVEKRMAYNAPAMADCPERIWSRFFPGSVDGIPVKTYILKQTWSKPRDVVRLLMTLQDFSGDRERFSEQGFFSIRPEYSKRAWAEIEEELRTNFSVEFVDGVRKILSGITCPFTMDDLRSKAEREAGLYANAAKVLSEKTLPELVDLLFKFGIIGNVRDREGRSGRARFVAYGEDEPDVFGKFAVHYPLRSMFDVRTDSAVW